MMFTGSPTKAKRAKAMNATIRRTGIACRMRERMKAGMADMSLAQIHPR
jgi:hypothetical protein